MEESRSEEGNQASTPPVAIFSSPLRPLISICLHGDYCEFIIPEFSHFHSFLESFLQTQTVSCSSVIRINLINPV